MKRTEKKTSREQWKSSFSKIILHRVQNDLLNDPHGNKKQFKVAKLLYNTNQPYPAIKALEIIPEVHKRRFEYYELLAKCHMQLLNRNQNHLYAARDAFQECLKLVPRDFTRVIYLPRILYPLANIYMIAKSYSSALNMYHNIIQSFPNSIAGYKSRYRAAILLYYFSIVGDENSTEYANRSIIFLEQILSNENNIGGLDLTEITMVYAVFCEHSIASPHHFKANIGYNQAFKMTPQLQQKKYRGNWREWANNPIVWFNLCKRLMTKKYFIVAIEILKHAFYIIQEKLNQSLEIEHILFAMDLYILFDEKKTALYYGELGLEINYFDYRLRNIIGEISEEYRLIFLHEERGANAIRRQFKTRIWTKLSFKHYKEQCIEEWEEKIQDRLLYYNVIIRDKLGYHAKSKWRPLFAFEESQICCIQRWWKKIYIKKCKQKRIKT